MCVWRMVRARKNLSIDLSMFIIIIFSLVIYIPLNDKIDR